MLAAATTSTGDKAGQKDTETPSLRRKLQPTSSVRAERFSGVNASPSTPAFQRLPAQRLCRGPSRADEHTVPKEISTTLKELTGTLWLHPPGLESFEVGPFSPARSLASPIRLTDHLLYRAGDLLRRTCDTVLVYNSLSKDGKSPSWARSAG
jgi:hypothetical protein